MDRTLNLRRARWSEQELTLLKAGIAEGLSGSQIAEKMLASGFKRTRNAVIGKYHRMLSRHKVLPLALSKERDKSIELTPREILIGDLAFLFKRATIYEICEAVGADFNTEHFDVRWAIAMVLGNCLRAIGSEKDCAKRESQERIAKMRAIVAREVAA